MSNYHRERNEAAWQGNLLHCLRHNECYVQFEKVDGTIRDMKCTLQESVVPVTKGTGKANPVGVLTVFDTEKQGWRTIKFDKLIDFSIQTEYVRAVD